MTAIEEYRVQGESWGKIAFAMMNLSPVAQSPFPDWTRAFMEGFAAGVTKDMNVRMREIDRSHVTELTDVPFTVTGPVRDARPAPQDEDSPFQVAGEGFYDPAAGRLSLHPAGIMLPPADRCASLMEEDSP
jgi:hypothetical protein